MKSKGLLTFILVAIVFIIPALPPLDSAIALPETTLVQASMMDYYYSAREILYASLAISIANVALAYKVVKSKK